MASTEDNLLVAVRDVIDNDVTTPNLRAREGAEAIVGLPDNVVQLTPLAMPRDPAGGGTQRWHLGVLIVLRSRIIAPTGSTSTWTNVFDATRALLSAIDAAAALKGGGSAGVEQVRRGEVKYWVKPPGGNGDPAGCVFTLTADWAE